MPGKFNHKLLKMKKLFVLISTAAVIYALSCTGDTETSKPLNPNGDSELALLMRSMFDDGVQVKEAIKNGGMPSVLVEFEKIHTAKPTVPGKADTPEFKAFAGAYTQAVLALKTAAPDEVEAHYTAMVNACMNCHNAVCPGPTRRIKKLYL